MKDRNKKIKELEDRLLKFALEIIELVHSLSSKKSNLILASIFTQVIKSSSSLGANYGEACEAETKKDFEHKIAICRKESRETRFWLRLVLLGAKSISNLEKEKIQLLGNEAREFNLIFNSILSSSKKKK